MRNASDSTKVGLITLGCAKNEVDSEYMLADLRAGGFEPVDDFSRAEAVVVNTCAFIGPAREEAVEMILKAARYKTSGACRVLAVVGCLAQRYRAELEESLPEVDVFIGVGADQRSLPAQLRDHLGLSAPPACDLPSDPRVSTTAGQGWAYLKISEGCNNRCSYCAIPLIRGALASRPANDIVREARYLESLGVQELVLIAQDVTAWGADRGDSTGGLVSLLEILLESTRLPWIRLLYTHPARLGEPLLRLIGAESRIVSYLDMPVQHVSDRVLERMGRGVTGSQIRERIALARKLIEDLVLRTTVMVGFPGERQQDFEELLEFVADVRFDRLGAFVYSEEEGTRASSWRNSVTRGEKERRLEAVMELQRQISAELNAARVGSVMDVLVERRVEDDEAPGEQYRWAGRGPAHAPEVDGQVYLAGYPEVKSQIAPGKIIRAGIVESGDYDLFGAPVAG